jgi:hypothetical protein
MNYHAVLAALSGVLTVVAMVPYVKDIFMGTTRPNAISFSLWTVLQVIALSAQLEAGASWSIVVVILVTVNTAIISVIAFTRYGYRKYGKTEGISFALAIVAIAALQYNPEFAIVCAIVADLCAAAPTVKKTYLDPQSESANGWGLMTLGFALGTLSTQKWDFANVAMPAYLTLITGLIFLFARRK